MKIDIAQITGLILAGGRGSRMGGVDKGLQLFDGRPMAAHVIERLASQVASLMINANQNLESYQALGWPVWPDQFAGFAGPLAGLQTGLLHCKTPYIVSAPCDSPFLPADLVERLADALVIEDADLALAFTGNAQSRQPHPVFCLLKASLLPHLTAYLEAGGRKVDAWFKALKVAEVNFPEEAAFRNINTLEELRQYETK